MERQFKCRLNDTIHFLTHSVLCVKIYFLNFFSRLENLNFLMQKVSPNRNNSNYKKNFSKISSYIFYDFLKMCRNMHSSHIFLLLIQIFSDIVGGRQILALWALERAWQTVFCVNR